MRIQGESQSQTLNILGHPISGRCESDTTWSCDTYLIFGMAAHGKSRLQNESFNTHRRHMCDSKRLDVLPFYKKLMAVWCIRLLKDGAFFASCRFGMALLHHMKYWQSGPFGVEGTITPWRKTSAECYDRIERIERKCPPWHRKSVFASTQITNSSSGSLDFFCVRVRRKSPMVACAVPNFTINEKGYSIA